MPVKKPPHAELFYQRKRLSASAPVPLFSTAHPAVSDECAEAAVAHDQNVVARLRGFNNHLYQRVDVGAPVGWLNAGVSHFHHLPRNVVRLEQEHFISATEGRREIVFADAHFHGVGARLQHGDDARGAAHFATQRSKRREDSSRVMREIVIHGDAVGLAAQFKAAARVDKRAERLRGVSRRHAHMARRGDSRQAVLHVVLAHQLPLHLAYAFAVQPDFPFRGVIGEFFRLPAALLAELLLLAPAAHRHHLFQVDVVFRPDDFPLPRHDAYQMVELLLDGFEIVKDIGVVEFEVVQHQRARRVVNKLGAFIKERAVIFIRFDNEKRAVAQARGDVEIARHATDNEARLIAAGFQNPGRHARRGGFAVGARHRHDPAVAQHEIMQPLRAGHIRNALLQHRLDARIAAGHGVADHHQIRSRLQLRGVIALN